MQGIGNEQPVFAYKDASYCMSASNDNGSTGFSMAIAGKGEYNILNMPISRSLHIQQLVKHEYVDLESIGTTDTLAVAQRRYDKAPPPEQPQGLRMRYQPVGVIEKRKSGFLEGTNKRTKVRGKHREINSPTQHEATGEAAAHKAKRKAEKADKAARKEQKDLRKRPRRNQSLVGEEIYRRRFSHLTLLL